MTGKPVLLLDIDGVLNVVKPRTNIWPARQWVERKFEHLSLAVAGPVIDFFNSMDIMGNVEIRWHTTWQEQALDFGDLFGFRTFHVQSAPEFSKTDDSHWWKEPAARRVLTEEKRPLIWIDDDLKFSSEAKSWFSTLEQDASYWALISPFSNDGLTKRQLRTVEECVTKAIEPLELEETH